MISPGSTIGMLGGGQLGRMFTMAARSLGYEVIVLEPDPHSPAGSVANEHLCAPYHDEKALISLGERCDVVTTEFENIPASTLRFLTHYCPVRPSAEAVEVAQNRVREKTYAQQAGLATAPFIAVNALDDLDASDEVLSFPAILKSAELGYDGKGQSVVASVDEARAAFIEMGQVPCVLEQKIDLDLEISVVLARGESGETICFPSAENEHRNGILHQSIVPARIDETLVDKARESAIALAEALDFCGVMAVEFFISKSGDLLINEIAPRTHNSGHFSLDACITSQFEQQVRAVCGLPFGAVDLLTPVVMVNLLGDIWASGEPRWGELLANPRVRLNLYGKKEARPGRKMGHFCVVGENRQTCLDEAEAGFNGLPAK